MADSRIAVSRIIHTIHAAHDIHACRLLYQDALGGLVFAENYFPAEDRDAALLYVTNHMVEPMAPRHADDLTKPFARMAAFRWNTIWTTVPSMRPCPLPWPA